jgi:hypothetical protein
MDEKNMRLSSQLSLHLGIFHWKPFCQMFHQYGLNQGLIPKENNFSFGENPKLGRFMFVIM